MKKHTSKTSFGIWLTGMGLSVSLLLIVGLLGLITWEGLQVFWPKALYEWKLQDTNTGTPERLWGEKVLVRTQAGARRATPSKETTKELQLFQGSREHFGQGYRFVSLGQITESSHPQDLMVLHRQEYGRAIVKPLNGELLQQKPQDKIDQLHYQLSDGSEHSIVLAQVMDFYAPNQMGWGDKLARFGKNIWHFLSQAPREANTEGGIFPALVGTLTMTILMSLAVVPLGIIGALYLSEYAKAGPWQRLLRIAVNNLAGIPSIVFGVFGLGFFVYLVGGGLDQWLFADKLPEPTLGTGGLLWASLTLALMTVPVVIVSTEQALRAIPSGVREGALACGANRWQTIRRLLLPAATPGILTGAILAMARGAGEVAPLMLVGVVKLAPQLPVSGSFPFVHLDQKFMHLGFHIFDLGFHSPDSEAAKPMIFATTLLLIALVLLLNLGALMLRERLRKKYVMSAAH